MKKVIGNIVTALILIVGLGVLLYPTISDYWNARLQGQAIGVYERAISEMSENDLSAISDNAHAYNDDIAARGSYIHEMSAQELDEYNSLLNVGGSGMMGHIEIEKLGVDLPLYHTVDEAVLQVGVGHIPGSSLPVGGPSTHTVLSGHRGLPTSKLFTELDRMEEGDIFSLYVLDQQLVYEVDQILTVLQDDVSGW
ncbi:MAG: class C sortase, partial [Eggerthellaceae bacterium]|nr:class C sortase [Eggerthellaceae bacterium]